MLMRPKIADDGKVGVQRVSRCMIQASLVDFTRTTRPQKERLGEIISE